ALLTRRARTGRPPALPCQDHPRPQAHAILPALAHRLPPLSLQVVLQRHAERTVVAGRAGTTVDFTTRKHEATTFAQIDDGIDGVCRHCTLRVRGETTGLTAQGIRPSGPGRTGTRTRTVTLTGPADAGAQDFPPCPRGRADAARPAPCGTGTRGVPPR